VAGTDTTAGVLRIRQTEAWLEPEQANSLKTKPEVKHDNCVCDRLTVAYGQLSV